MADFDLIIQFGSEDIAKRIDAASFPPLLIASDMSDLYSKLNDTSWYLSGITLTDGKPYIRKIMVNFQLFTLVVTRSAYITQFLFGPVILNEDGTFDEATHYESYILKRTFFSVDIPGHWYYVDKKDFININAYKPLSEGYYTFDSARAALPPSMCKSGIILTWKSAEGEWQLKQFTGANWSNDSDWKDISGGSGSGSGSDADMTAAADIYNVTQKIPLGTGNGYYTPETARAAVPVAIRKTGLIITYWVSHYVWVMEQYNTRLTVDNYWNSPGNWTKIWESTYPATAVMTESAYDALPEKDPFTLYFIK
jgi:hypothetical protein